jgi:alpha-mannosidase
VRGENRLEGPFYAVEISPITGGIVSLFDKTRGVELADPASPYHLNQCLYLSDDVEHTPGAAVIDYGASGPLFAQLVVRAHLKNTALVSTITLYATYDRVDIRNELDKEPTFERQELDFAFPFQVPDCQVRYELPGAIVAPGADHLPGSGLNVYTVRHFVDLFNDDHGVTLSQADSGLFELGRRTTHEDPTNPVLDNSTVLALAMENTIDWNEAIRNQAGIRHFVYRYSIRGHAGGFDPVSALHFGWADNNPLETAPLQPGQKGVLPADKHSFVSVTPDNVILAGFKPAEEDGLIARLWECAGHDATVRLTVSGLGHLEAASTADLMERNDVPLPAEGDTVTTTLRPHSIATMRLHI